MTRDEALKLSIKKWKKTVTFLEANIGEELVVSRHHEASVNNVRIRYTGDDCPLCELTPSDTYICENCPVFEATGHRNCRASPWEKFYDKLKASSIVTRELVTIAKEEVEFLKGLQKSTRKNENI